MKADNLGASFDATISFGRLLEKVAREYLSPTDMREEFLQIAYFGGCLMREMGAGRIAGQSLKLPEPIF